MSFGLVVAELPPLDGGGAVDEPPFAHAPAIIRTTEIPASRTRTRRRPIAFPLLRSGVRRLRSGRDRIPRACRLSTVDYPGATVRPNARIRRGRSAVEGVH